MQPVRVGWGSGWPVGVGGSEGVGVGGGGAKLLRIVPVVQVASHLLQLLTSRDL